MTHGENAYAKALDRISEQGAARISILNFAEPNRAFAARYASRKERCFPNLRHYWTNVCGACAINHHCTPSAQRRVTRWEHEHLLEAVQRRLDADPGTMRVRRETVEHSFGTIKARMGATHFLMKTMPRVATEMALHVLAYMIGLHRRV